MTEHWRDIPGYEGEYKVSDLGRVRSLKRIIYRQDGRKHSVQARILKPRLLKSGHYHVALCRSGERIDRRIHQLVLLAFVGPVPEGCECCHNDRDHANNHLTNLRYDTHQENMRDTVGHRLHQMIPVIRSDGKKYLSGAEAARDIGVYRSSVHRSIRLGHICCGFRFKFG